MFIDDIVIDSYCTKCELLGRQKYWNLGSGMHCLGTNWRVRKWSARDTATHRSSCTLRDDEGCDVINNDRKSTSVRQRLNSANENNL
jgi:hypothetical protein